MFDDFTNEVLKPLSDGVNVVNHNAERSLCGIGFVMLPKLVKRKTYIDKCYKNNSVSIITTKNEVIDNCQVSRDVWQYIKFPKTVNDKGTMVFWANIPNTNKPIIITTINKRNELVENRYENSFKFVRESENGSVTIEGQGDKGIFNVFIDGEDDQTGKLIVRVLNSLTKGLVSLYCQGNVNLEIDDTFNLKIRNSLMMQFINEEDNTIQTNISYVLGEGFRYVDEFGNKIIMNELINISNAATSLKEVLNAIIKMYLNTTTIDGKTLSPSSINSAINLYKQVATIFS